MPSQPLHLLLLPALLLPALCHAQAWQYHKDFEGRFAVEVPGEMASSTDTVEAPVGQLVYHTAFYQPPKADKASDNLMYMVSYCDYPEGTFHKDSLSLTTAFFEATMDAAAFSVNGELLYQTERAYRGQPGRFWRIDYLDGNAIIKTWGILDGDRYYAVQTATVKTRSLNTSSDRFFDSFRIIPPEGLSPDE